MPDDARIEFRDIALQAEIGHYPPGTPRPAHNLLDLTLWVDPALVLVARDSMDDVFDYDPLLARIDALARDGPYVTQEWLLCRIAHACAAEAEVRAVRIALRKAPVLRGAGALGLRVTLDGVQLAQLRAAG